MKFCESFLKGVYLIEPIIYRDDRGYFTETFSRNKLPFLPEHEFVQHNQSYSVEKGTIRGLHFQKPPFSQSKLVRVITGSIIDVVVDLRLESTTFGQWDSFELDENNMKMVYIPRGFAHGFVTMTPNVTFFYLCDNYYNKDSEGGVIWNDSSLNIEWHTKNPILSEKDKVLPTIGQIRESLPKDWM